MAGTLTGIGKGIKAIILTALSVYTLISCQVSEVDTMENNVSEQVIQLILDSNEIQQYLHPDTKNRIPVRVATNNLIPNHIVVKKFDKPVLFSQQTPTEPHFEIVTFKDSGDFIEFFIRYDVEGVRISGTAVVDGNRVSLTVLDVIES